MKVLALDSATSACSVALWADGNVLARRFSAMARGQSEALVPMVAEILDEAGLSFSGLDLLAVTVGPGAFTGIRIGLAAARGLALATGLPLAGVTTLEAVAAGVPMAERAGRTLIVALDSKRDEMWVQAFAEDLAPLSAPEALLPERIAGRFPGPLVVAGDCAQRFASGQVALSQAPGLPDAAIVAALAARHWQDGTALAPAPLYLRPADVTIACS